MEKFKTSRIESIDLLRGFVMVVMALDHTRNYFHFGGLAGNDPTNLLTTTPILFFTRFITHFCAPVFIFLAGTSSFLYGTKKNKNELSKFLLTRGIWLVFLEIVLNNLIWSFDITYGYLNFQVIWVIGFSMICLSILIYLPKKVLLVIGLVIIAGHNFLDPIILEGKSLISMIWYFLYQGTMVQINNNLWIGVWYPVLPWLGVMLLGYCFGTFYNKNFSPSVRKKWIMILGISSTILFFVLRGINIYGDMHPWSFQKNTLYTILSYLNVSKYPPSLLFILITLGPALLILNVFESIKNKFTNFFLVYGRVPLFYYFFHIFLIHVFAMLGLVITGANLRIMILNNDLYGNHINLLVDYGYNLLVVYLVWVFIVLLLYPVCKSYMIYKFSHKEKPWLSYL